MKKLSLSFIAVFIAVIFCACAPKEIEQITLSNNDVTLAVGDTSSLNVIVMPKDAPTKGIVWSSGNEKIARVSDGTITAVGSGSTVITAMADNGVKATCNVKVEDVEVTSVTITSGPSEIKSGKSVQLEAKVAPAEAQGAQLSWTSSNPAVAVVDSSGYVTGVKKGVVSITCTAPNGKSASCTISVKGKKKKSSSGKNTTVVYYTPYNQREIGDRYASDFVFYDSSYRTLSPSEVAGLSSSQIQQAINEIYARNGYCFQNKSIRAYYESMSWYYPNPSFSQSDFNSTEQHNIALLKKYK